MFITHDFREGDAMDCGGADLLDHNTELTTSPFGNPMGCHRSQQFPPLWMPANHGSILYHNGIRNFLFLNEAFLQTLISHSHPLTETSSYLKRISIGWQETFRCSMSSSRRLGRGCEHDTDTILPQTGHCTHPRLKGHSPDHKWEIHPMRIRLIGHLRAERYSRQMDCGSA
jgi:hypothetical protein